MRKNTKMHTDEIRLKEHKQWKRTYNGAAGSWTGHSGSRHTAARQPGVEWSPCY